jgi:hypothetical protein
LPESGELVLEVRPSLEDDAGDLSRLAGWLRAELLDLDVQRVDHVPGTDVPSGAKGLAAVAAWLSVHLASEALPAVLAKVADWATRNDRTVEVSYGGDTLRLGRATREQQEKIIDGWLARHPPAS